MTRVGLISDTHGLVRPSALASLAGCDRILHAGDICDPDVLAALATIAPVLAVRGNNDIGDWADALDDEAIVEIDGVRIAMIHDLARHDASRGDVRVVVSGHSHKPLVTERGGVLYVNPGSAGPRRFSLPISMGVLRIARGTCTAEVVTLTS